MTHTRSPLFAAACGAVAVIGLGLFSSLAFAALSPLAIDADSDGAWIAVVDTNGDGKLDHLDIGVKASEYDCDDTFDTVSPLLTEIVGNKTDDDCSSGIPVNHITGDAKWPVSDDELARWKANWPIPWSDLGFIASHGRLSAAGSHVTIVKLASGEEAGTFKVDEGYQAGDWITGSLPADREFSAVKVKADGILDVFTDSEVEHVTRLTPAKPRSSGLGKKAVTEIADASADAAVRPLREELILATGELRAVDTVLAQGIDKLWKADEDLAEGLAAEERARIEAIAEERRLREIAVGEAAALADKAQREAEGARREAGTALEAGQTAQSHGPLFEVGGVGGAIVRQSLPILAENRIPTGEFARQAAIGGGGIELRVGADLAGVQGAAFGQVFVGSDGVGTGAGSGPDMGILVGGDLLAEAGQVEIGGWVGYLHTEDHSLNLDLGEDYLETTVREDGVVGGVLLQGDLTGDYSAGRVVPFLRIGAGVGNLHARRQSLGEIHVKSDVGPLVLLQFGVRSGAGALRR